ncbi:phospholipase A2 group XV-like [Paramacrobiotus metropolitanus]|uniref:phospholipase A2 group XV-like n=1 Tax=Paramacrobiotus metropolitanus TaxID=2943436 RepID=UPI00244578D7|nr:phospholipase A2 group XV-like [Paramacrobiotus metropolitanus]
MATVWQRVSLVVLVVAVFCALCHGGLLERFKNKISGQKQAGSGGDVSVPEGAYGLTAAAGSPSDTQGHVRQTQINSPVIILPGDGGSPLEAMLDKPSVKFRHCPKKTTGWQHVWAGIEILVPAIVDCWVDNLRLVYDNVTRRTSNSPGVKTRVPGFGGTRSIEYLTSKPLPSSRYMADLVERLVSLGYQRGVSIRGAPYDFRKAQNEQHEYFVALKDLVEETYELNHHSSVTFIAHSLGCLYLLYFLQQQPQEWKDKYVASFIGLGGPWGGAVKPLKVVASGDDLGINIVSHSRMRDVLRTKPSIAVLFPSDQLWKQDEVLMSTADRTYTLGNLRQFFYDIRYPEGWEYYQDTRPIANSRQPPRVPMYCISGTGVDTPASYQYSNLGVPSGRPTVVMEDGDGTVNRRSLDACGWWGTQQNETVTSMVFPRAGHLKMIKDPVILDYIVSILFP